MINYVKMSTALLFLLGCLPWLGFGAIMEEDHELLNYSVIQQHIFVEQPWLHWVCKLMGDRGVCRTAPATPGRFMT